MSSAPARKVPKTGDRRVTKKHGLQIRIPEICQFGPGKGARVYRGGRPGFEWCKLAYLPRIYHHYLTAEERAALDQRPEA